MTPFPGHVPMVPEAPCVEGVTISSIGTADVGDPNLGCSTGPAISVSVTLSGSLPAGWSLQAKGYIGSSAASYSDASTMSTVSFSGSSGTVVSPFISTFNEEKAVLGSTRYYNIQIQLLDDDGTTVCDGPDWGTEGSSGGWSACE